MTKSRGILPPRKFWTPDEDARLVEAWKSVVDGTRTARQVLAEFPGRTLCSIRNRAASRLRVAGQRTPRVLPMDWEDQLRRFHAEGYADAAIARAWGLTRRYITDVRHRLGLPPNTRHERQREAVRQKTREQLKRAGLNSIGELRARRFRQFAASLGWPEDLRVRSVQILELLLAEPALTRRQICERLQIRWKGSRKSLASNDPEGSYLANLAARGLVEASPRVWFGNRDGRRGGCGKNVRVYSATPLAHEMKARFLASQGSHSNSPTPPSPIQAKEESCVQSTQVQPLADSGHAAGSQSQSRSPAGADRVQAD